MTPILGTSESGRSIHINVEALVQTRLVLTAMSGWGKSFAIRRILEQTHGKVQHIVLDPEGEFYTLRSKYDYVLAGRNGDCPAEPRSAELLAIRLLELRVSAIIDLYDLPRADRIQFVKLFCESLLSAPQNLYHPCIVVLDEAHVMAPERGFGEAASLEAVVNLMAQGRKRLLCPILATQRLSKLAKSAISEAHNWMVGKATLPIDVSSSISCLGMARGTESDNLIRKLPRGEFYTFGPAFCEEPTRVLVGDTETKAPRIGSHMTAPAPASAEVQGLLAKLADLPAEAEKELKSRAELQGEIAKLRRELRDGKREKPATAADPAAIQKAFERGAHSVKKELGKQLVGYMRFWKWRIDEARKALTTIEQAREALTTDSEPEYPDLEKLVGLVQDEPPPARMYFLNEQHETRVRKPEPAPTDLSASNGDLTGPGRKILASLRELEACGISKAPRVFIAMLSNYSNIRSAGFAKALSQLSTEGHVIYPDASSVGLTETGRGIAPHVSRPRSAQELQQRIVQTLGGTKGKMLETIIGMYPEPMDREVLGNVLGYGNLRSAGFAKALSTLSSLGLVEYPDSKSVCAKAFLFLQ